MRKSWPVVPLVSMLLLLVCSYGAVTAKTTIRFAFSNPSRDPQEVIEQLVADFMVEYPHIQVVVEAEYGSNVDKLVTHMAGGAAADIIEGFNELALVGIRSGFFLDLQPLIQRDNQQALLNDFLPSIIEQFSYKGGLYGFPQSQSVGIIYYNRDMFSAYGLPPPPDNWGWSEFASLTMKLTKTDGAGAVTTMGYEQNQRWLWSFWWFEAAGADFSRPDVLPFDTQPMYDTFAFLTELVQGGYARWRTGLFTRGQAGMINSGAWEFSYLKNSQVPLGVALVPIGPVKRVALTNTNIVAINRDTKHVEECWTFLKWWYSRETQLKYLELLGQQPARLSLGPYWVAYMKNFYKAAGAPEVERLEKATLSAAFARPQPFFGDAAVITRYIEPALVDILQRNQPYPAVLENTAKAGTAFLQESLQQTAGE